MNKKPLTKVAILSLLKKIKKINLGRETLILDKTVGRFLDQNIVSKINLPPFKNSAVDGYAINQKDILIKNINLTFNQRLIAGGERSKDIKKGEAARIFTGARMPRNSQTVIMQENVIKIDNLIKIIKMPKYGENCRMAGEDISKGQKIFSKGNVIDSTNINLIAAIGKKYIAVKKKLNVGFFTSGNELTDPTEKLLGSQINNSNYYSLNALLKTDYINSKYLGNLRDDEKIITSKFLKYTNKYNVIITTGGASVGEEDYLIKVIKKIGKIYFWKTAIKPGRPLAIGKIKNTLFICLPGNPVSVHLLYGMIIKPFLKFLCNGELNLPKSFLVKTDFTMRKKNMRLEWLRVKLNKNKLIVSKYPKQGSGMISSMVFADGILEVPENIKIINKGDYFNFYSFESLFN